LSALARLGLARAYAIQSDTAKAKAAYQDFLALWKVPTRIFLSSSLRSLSTPSCNSYLNRIRKIGKSGQLLICRLLLANLLNHFSKRGLGGKCYSFPVGFLF
jgi:hypothetical protein